VRCSALQCVAVCCSALQCVAVRCSALQCVAVRCSAVQRVAARCCVLQCVAVCWSALQSLQCVAVCCSVLQMCSSALQCVAVICGVLQCVAAGCSVSIGLLTMSGWCFEFCLENSISLLHSLCSSVSVCSSSLLQDSRFSCKIKSMIASAKWHATKGHVPFGCYLSPLRSPRALPHLSVSRNNFFLKCEYQFCWIIIPFWSTWAEHMICFMLF